MRVIKRIIPSARECPGRFAPGVFAVRTAAVRPGMHVITDHCMHGLSRPHAEVARSRERPQLCEGRRRWGDLQANTIHRPRRRWMRRTRPFSLSSHHEISPPISRLMVGSAFELSVLTEGASNAWHLQRPTYVSSWLSLHHLTFLSTDLPLSPSINPSQSLVLINTIHYLAPIVQDGDPQPAPGGRQLQQEHNPLLESCCPGACPPSSHRDCTQRNSRSSTDRPHVSRMPLVFKSVFTDNAVQDGHSSPCHS